MNGLRVLREGLVVESQLNLKGLGEKPNRHLESGEGSQNPQGVDGRDPLSWYREQPMSQPPDVAPVVMDPVELFRIRCLREAEQLV